MTTQELLLDLTKDAGNAIRSIDPSSGVTEKKGSGNFVTAADKTSERIIMSGIKKYFPTHTILSEETASLLSQEQLRNAPNLWVIDPIDGTADFRYQLHHCAVSVAYIESGTVMSGCVFNPFTNDVYLAHRKQGAYLNDKRIFVTKKTTLEKATVSTTNAYSPEERRIHIETLLKLPITPWSTIRGSGALSLCEVAAAKTDLCFSFVLNPWDTAAAHLILEEAGSAVVNKKGERADFFSPEIIVGHSKLVQAFLEIINS